MLDRQQHCHCSILMDDPAFKGGCGLACEMKAGCGLAIEASCSYIRKRQSSGPGLYGRWDCSKYPLITGPDLDPAVYNTVPYCYYLENTPQ